jgi:hypothetical protein
MFSLMGLMCKKYKGIIQVHLNPATFLSLIGFLGLFMQVYCYSAANYNPSKKGIDV